MAKQNNRVLISQSLFRAQYDPFVVTSLNESELTADCVASILQTATKGALGIASSHGPKGVLTYLAVSTPTNCLYIRMAAPSTKSKDKKKADKTSPSGRTILQAILVHPDYRKLAFDMHGIAAALHLDRALAITKAIDLQSLSHKPRPSPDTLLEILGGADKLYKEKVLDAFRGEAFDAATMQNVCLRAWASCQTASNPKLERYHKSARTIDTPAISEQDLNAICKFIRDAERLDALKPKKVKNDVAAQFSFESDVLNVDMTRFKTRMRRNRFRDQQLVVEFKDKDRPNSSACGRVVRAHGKSAQVTIDAAVSATSKIRSIYTVGKDAPTPAEEQRTLVSLHVLQRKVSLPKYAIARKIFVPSSADLASPVASVNPPCAAAITVPFPLNQSQLKAARNILSNDVSLVHGPPGTGKTTVIAAVVMALAPTLTDKEGIWLVAHSNVAVKNIAEKLARVGFLNFKLLVSEEFHYEWHEHLYSKIESNVIRSDEFDDDLAGTDRLLLDSKVILCTLGMVSNFRVAKVGFMRLVPITTVIVDEASQIELGSYLPLLCNFGHTIRRIAFIGDDKQLAPYGQDDIGTLNSVFELKHLRKSSVFLDTQYRMPAPIGEFISRHIYDGRLKSSHSVTSPLSCRLVDVGNGKEQKASGSWVNDVEANVVIVIAKKLHAQGKVYRIITPYDAQRNLLEKKLKSSEIPWEDKCFNVDSFQGSEDDHIIISVVRSEKVGFLTNLRRTNVMLSRCKQSMIICTSRAFLEQKAPKTLIGKLAAEWGQSSWISVKDILAGNL